ncbi:YtxH domain-containing protein [Bacillus sp. 03113]|uniref:YtxH domain-containing protein n=1 Tax=Bacillus sp. 03113 TaxID=2578211 RepID=UPI001142A684|nr:YtxH domain-containing protein [Bacillus sp. 03113]
MATNERNIENIDQEEQINTKDFLIGALVGGIVGATAALLLAPKSGKELLNDINVQASSIKEKGDNIRKVVKLRGVELATTAKDKTENISQAVVEQSSHLLNKVKKIKSDILSESELAVSEPIEDEEDFISLNNQEEIKQKLDETKKVLDEAESKYHY